MFEHVYKVTTCPHCKAKLTEPQKVKIEFVDDEGRHIYRLSMLTPKGLLVDVDYLIASGFHSDTFCYSCDFALNEYEE